jgi:hypothetical protein
MGASESARYHMAAVTAQGGTWLKQLHNEAGCPGRRAIALNRFLLFRARVRICPQLWGISIEPFPFLSSASDRSWRGDEAVHEEQVMRDAIALLRGVYEEIDAAERLIHNGAP